MSQWLPYIMENSAGNRQERNMTRRPGHSFLSLETSKTYGGNIFDGFGVFSTSLEI